MIPTYEAMIDFFQRAGVQPDSTGDLPGLAIESWSANSRRFMIRRYPDGGFQLWYLLTFRDQAMLEQFLRLLIYPEKPM